MPNKKWVRAAEEGLVTGVAAVLVVPAVVLLAPLCLVFYAYWTIVDAYPVNYK